MFKLLAVLYTVTGCSGILRKQFLQHPIYVRGEDDPGEPLFLTPYVKKGDYETGIFCNARCILLSFYSQKLAGSIECKGTYNLC